MNGLIISLAGLHQLSFLSLTASSYSEREERSGGHVVGEGGEEGGREMKGETLFISGNRQR